MSAAGEAWGRRPSTRPAAEETRPLRRKDSAVTQGTPRALQTEGPARGQCWLVMAGSPGPAAGRSGFEPWLGHLVAADRRPVTEPLESQFGVFHL